MFRYEGSAGDKPDDSGFKKIETNSRTFATEDNRKLLF
ncbi:hypothetical protein QE439_003654 [Pedobacter agri]|nr:hypothetical protein [Pedobacter agri]